MFFPLSRSFRGTVSRGFVSIPVRGANKALLAGLAPPAAPLLATNPSYRQIRKIKMSRDVSGQSDISKMTVEPDGSFKRAPSSFRNFIQKGGQFPPEKGMLLKPFPVRILATLPMFHPS